MAEFNINNYVFVKLTEAGRAEHKRKHDELKELLPNLKEYSPPVEDAEGWSRFQGWVLMNTFGHMLGPAKEPPFETTIRFNKNNLRERRDERI